MKFSIFVHSLDFLLLFYQEKSKARPAKGHTEIKKQKLNKPKLILMNHLIHSSYITNNSKNWAAAGLSALVPTTSSPSQRCHAELVEAPTPTQTNATIPAAHQFGKNVRHYIPISKRKNELQFVPTPVWENDKLKMMKSKNTTTHNLNWI